MSSVQAMPRLRRLAQQAWPPLVAAVVAVLVGRLVPTVSPLLWSMALGILVANSPLMPEQGLKGPQRAAKTLLRLGIVAMGALLSWSALAALGLTGLLVIVATVVLVFTLTCVIGDRLGLPRGLVTLTAAGFSICGAAAIAAVEGSIRRRDEDVALALAMVTIFGTVMTFVVPALGAALGLGPEDVGIWVGASIHEVAQVVVAASLVATSAGAAGAALTAATTIKLGRVALLVLAYLGALRREGGGRGGHRSAVRLRDFVPWFLVGFALMALARSVGLLPEAALDPVTSLGTFLLAAGMFGLGLDIRVSRLLPLPPAVLGLSAASTGIALVVPLVLLTVL